MLTKTQLIVLKQIEEGKLVAFYYQTESSKFLITSEKDATKKQKENALSAFEVKKLMESENL